MDNLQKKYQHEVIPKLKEEFNLKNNLALPKLEKIVLNAGVGEGISSKDVPEKVKDQLSQISGQRPRITLAKKAISTFKLKKNDPIGVMVTLRGKRAWQFLEKLIKIKPEKLVDGRLEKFGSMGKYVE